MERLTTNDELKQPWVIPANERTWRDIYKKLSAYEDAEEDGLLIVLPCKVGDMVWTHGAAKGTIQSFSAPDIHWIIDNIGSFGKTVFLTREEAEAALATMEGLL